MGAAGRVESASLLRCSKDHRPGDLSIRDALSGRLLLFFNVYFIVYVCMSACIYVILPATCMPCALTGQKKTSDSLELELQIVLNCHVGPRSQAQGPCKNNKCS